MAGALKTLFGGSDTKQQQTSGPVDVTPGEVTDLRAQFAPALAALFGGDTGGISGIPGFDPSDAGGLVAQLGTGESQVLQTLLDDLKGPRQGLITDTLAGNFLPGTEGSNPFLNAAIEAAQRPTLQGLEEVLSRTLPGRFTQAGQFVQPQGSSAFDRAAAIASRGAADALADIATNLSFGVHEAERGRQQEAIQLGQNEIQTLTTNLQAQALPRLIEDLGIQRGLQEYQTRLEALLRAFQIATGTPLQTVASESQGTSTSNTQTGIIPGLGKLFSFSGTV